MKDLVNSYMESISLPACRLHAMQKSTTGRKKIKKMRRGCVCIYRISKEAQGRKSRNNMLSERVAAS